MVFGQAKDDTLRSRKLCPTDCIGFWTYLFLFGIRIWFDSQLQIQIRNSDPNYYFCWTRGVSLIGKGGCIYYVVVTYTNGGGAKHFFALVKG